jgi:hypothetical protein
MRQRLSGLWLLAMAVIVTGSARAIDPAHPGFIDPKPVTLQGYNGVAMEPFISRDGRYLFFNNSNDPGVDTNLYIADRVDDLTFRVRGPLAGANSRDLDAVASMDRFGTFYFVSTRDYGATGSLIHRGRFDGRRVTGVEVVPGLASKDHPGFNFDAEISADGQQLYYVQGRRGARIASLAVAERRGSGFVKAAGSDALLARVNALGMVYAPDISADGLELFFTRLPPGLLLFQPPPQIYLATRAAADQPFGQPVRLTGLGTFVEAPSLSPDGRWLYFHACAKGVCRLFAARRATDK